MVKMTADKGASFISFLNSALMESPDYVIELLRRMARLKDICGDSKKFKDLIKRLTGDSYLSAIFEMRLLSGYIEAGWQAEFIEEAKEPRPDIRVRIDNRWIYIEATIFEKSKRERDNEEIRCKIAEQLKPYCSQAFIEIDFQGAEGALWDKEADRIVELIENACKRKSCVRAVLGKIRVYVKPEEKGGPFPPIITGLKITDTKRALCRLGCKINQKCRQIKSFQPGVVAIYDVRFPLKHILGVDEEDFSTLIARLTSSPLISGVLIITESIETTQEHIRCGLQRTYTKHSPIRVTISLFPNENAWIPLSAEEIKGLMSLDF